MAGHSAPSPAKIERVDGRWILRRYHVACGTQYLGKRLFFAKATTHKFVPPIHRKRHKLTFRTTATLQRFDRFELSKARRNKHPTLN